MLYAKTLVVLMRPAVVLLMCVYTSIGFTQAGDAHTDFTLMRNLVTVIAFLVFSVAINDIADAAIDRVNVPHSNRPLVTGHADRKQMTAVALTSAALAIATAAIAGWPSLVVTVAGLSASAAYSLPPLRLAARGAVAALILPAGFVAVPYLVGLLSVRTTITADDALLLVALYLGFIGRILLKDFRDVRGDALFGKRTFLVRHGRRTTCIVSAAFWSLGGALVMAAVRRPTIVFLATTGIGLVAVVVLLRILASERSARRDEALISAIAIVGRTVLVLLLAQIAMTDEDWTAMKANALLAGIAIVMAGAIYEMLIHGPRSKIEMQPRSAVGSRAAEVIKRY